MATAYMQCDQLAINRINPYTATGAYGVNRDGFPKSLVMDPSDYLTGADETPMEVTEPIEVTSGLDFSGPMYLKTVEGRQPAPFAGYPARKMEYPDGTVTWYRPELPWSWMGGSDKEHAGGDGVVKFVKNNSFLFLLVFFALFLFMTLKAPKK